MTDHKLVPVEPTEEMLRKVLAKHYRRHNFIDQANAVLQGTGTGIMEMVILPAMQEVAAPTPPQSSRDAVISGAIHLEDVLHDAAIEQPFLHEGKWCISKDGALAGMTAVIKLLSTPTAPTITKETINAIVAEIIVSVPASSPEVIRRAMMATILRVHLTAALQKAKL